MMRRFFFPVIGMAVLMIFSACQSNATVVPLSQMEAIHTQAADPDETPIPGQTEVFPTPNQLVSPAATSRGSNLEASDPTLVRLASGQLQLVEFFRFT